MKDMQDEILRQRRLYATTVNIPGEEISEKGVKGGENSKIEERNREASEKSKRSMLTTWRAKALFRDNKLMHITFGEHITAAR